MQEDAGKKDKAALYDQLTPAQKRRYRTAVRLMIDYVLDNVPLSRENETQKDVESEQATKPRPVQLRMKF